MADLTEINDQPEGDLRPEDVKLLDALTAGGTNREAAAMLGESESSVYRRLRNPAVRAALAARRETLFQHHAALTAVETRKAIEKFAAIRDDPESTTDQKIDACARICDLALKLRNEVDILPRLAALEAQTAALLASVEDDV